MQTLAISGEGIILALIFLVAAIIVTLVFVLFPPSRSRADSPADSSKPSSDGVVRVRYVKGGLTISHGGVSVEVQGIEVQDDSDIAEKDFPDLYGEYMSDATPALRRYEIGQYFSDHGYCLRSIPGLYERAMAERARLEENKPWVPREGDEQLLRELSRRLAEYLRDGVVRPELAAAGAKRFGIELPTESMTPKQQARAADEVLYNSILTDESIRKMDLSQYSRYVEEEVKDSRNVRLEEMEDRAARDLEEKPRRISSYLPVTEGAEGGQEEE